MQQKEKKLVIVLVIVLAVIILAGGLVLYLGLQESSDVTVSEDARSLPYPGDIRDETAVVVKELSLPQKEPAFPGDDLESEYDGHLKRVKEFCEYLDGRDYIMEYAIAEGTYGRLLAIIARLSEKKPVVLKETSDATRLATNVYHFFRVLGKKDTLLVADILTHEREKLEALLALCYSWLMLDMKQPVPETTVSLETLYYYGAYFLNTLGGTSYLSRRDSKTASLVRYYSLLIVEQAERERKNPYGIDIAPHLERLATDLSMFGEEEYRLIYERELDAIRDRILKR